MRYLGLAAAILWFAGGTASAAPANLAQPTAGTTYFNRPGATLAEHDRVLKGCLLTAQESVHGPPIVIGGLVGAIMLGGQAAFLQRTRIEHCMVVRGWRVVRLASGDPVLEAFKADPRATLSGLVGATPPPGVVARVWNNEAVFTDTIRDQMPGYTVGRSLSLEALKLDTTFTAEMAKVRHPENGPFTKEILRKPAPLSALQAAGADSAIILVASKGRSPVKWTGLSLRREGPDPYIKAATLDGRPEMFGVWPARARKDETEEQVVAYVVPPGRWHIFTYGGLHTFCLGSPFFDVAAGDVIYAGLFDFSSDKLIPKMSLEPASAYLAPAPQVLAKLQPANWTNGLTRGCGEGGFAGYALEFPDAPYREGYRPAGS